MELQWNNNNNNNNNKIKNDYSITKIYSNRNVFILLWITVTNLNNIFQPFTVWSYIYLIQWVSGSLRKTMHYHLKNMPSHISINVDLFIDPLKPPCNYMFHLL
jgi:hypothetical protein